MPVVSNSTKMTQIPLILFGGKREGEGRGEKNRSEFGGPHHSFKRGGKRRKRGGKGEEEGRDRLPFLSVFPSTLQLFFLASTEGKKREGEGKERTKGGKPAPNRNRNLLCNRLQTQPSSKKRGKEGRGEEAKKKNSKK